ncbi:MAG TPA: type II/IV secretion system ATPase subunit [Nitrososphaerales archaeon]|nr:type II/IV secretion system ATPase subunit [Nitrososphaerales archaeon]
MLANYLVEFELPVRSGVSYKCAYSVYVYDSDASWTYHVKEPYLEPRIRRAVSTAVETLTTWLAPSPIIDLDPIGYLVAEMERAGLLASLTREEMSGATYFLARDILGYGPLDPLIRDPEIEDISCDGADRPAKVWHRRFNSTGWLETNVTFADEGRMDAIVSRLVHRSGRSISNYFPIVDSVLPEGYRLAATWGKEVTSRGSSFTIRKQRAEPFSVTDLVKSGSLSPEVAAYLWMLLDLKGFVVISGANASGKTTTLNALATLLNPAWKIVSIEDTREISLPHTGWKPLHTRGGVGGGISLFDLVKLSLRERPDFVILGEARGSEVQALFQSAASGSGCITTFHSPNVDSMVARLTQPPLSVSTSVLELIDALVFMVKSPESATRRVERVIETGDPSPVYEAASGGWRGTWEGSRRIEARAAGLGQSARKVESELKRRVDFIGEMVGKGTSDYRQVSKALRQFYLSSSLTL